MHQSEFAKSTYKEQLQDVIHVAQLCNHENLLKAVVSVLQQLMSSSSEFLILALKLADELEIDSLVGSAYYAMLFKGEQFWQEEAHLTPRHRLLLLNGYYKLTNEWERYRKSAPTYAHAQSCGVTWSQGQCKMSWEDFWRRQVTSERVMSCNLADITGRLRLITRELDRWGPWGQVCCFHLTMYVYIVDDIFIVNYDASRMPTGV